jgi:hypothetical protein
MEAVSFSERMVREKRIMPPEKPLVVQGYIQAAGADVSFSKSHAGQKGTLLDSFKKGYEGRTPHNLDVEQAPISDPRDGIAVLEPHQTPEPFDQNATEGTVSPERRRKLLSHTHSGRKILEDEAKGAKAMTANGAR